MSKRLRRAYRRSLAHLPDRLTFPVSGQARNRMRRLRPGLPRRPHPGAESDELLAVRNPEGRGPFRPRFMVERSRALRRRFPS
jgi:hypothetical protein